MTGFGDQLRMFAFKVETRSHDVFVGVVSEVKRSIVSGSEITGAPGQPVKSGNLFDSWNDELVSRDAAEITTNVKYAPAVEDGVGPHGPVTYGKNGVGGSFSVRLTRHAFPRIVEHVTRQVAR